MNDQSPSAGSVAVSTGGTFVSTGAPGSGSHEVLTFLPFQRTIDGKLALVIERFAKESCALV